MRKNIFIYFFLLLHVACKEGVLNNFPDDHTELAEVALEVLVHQVSMNQYEEPDPIIHAAFFNNVPASGSKIENHSAQKYSNSETVDTVFTYDEVPFIKETRTHMLVYDDGSSESRIEDLTPDGINPLYLLSEMPPSDEMIISRTVIKKGLMQVYNKEDELIIEEAYPETNLKEFIDSLLQYIQPFEGQVPPKYSPHSTPPGMQRIKQPDKTVQFIQELPINSHVSGINSNSVPLKAIATLNEEMNRTLTFELYNGMQLIHRKKYEYESDKLLGNYIGNNKISENPRSVEAETLQYNVQGIPVIYRIRTYYRINQTVVRVK